MRAVLFHAAPKQSTHDWNDFLRRIPNLRPPPQAEELALGIWLLPLPDCQTFLDDLMQLVQRPFPPASSKTLEVDFQPPWQTVS
jgi:hypothetical protein